MRHQLCVSLLLIALCAVQPAAALPDFDGELSTVDVPPGVVGTGFWVNTPHTDIRWTVTQLADNSWNYVYTLTVPDGSISHLIIACSPDLQVGELTNLMGDFSGVSIDTFTPGPSNPTLPGALHGIKFDNVNTTAAVFHFQTFRSPVWGNFYAIDGQAHNPGTFNSAWNAGFTDPTPTDPPDSGSIDHHILVPDTRSSPVPDASTIVLFCFGALQIMAVRKKILRQACER